MKRSELSLYLLVTIILITTGCNTYINIPLSNIAKGEWSEVKSVDGSTPIERHEAAFAEVNGMMYLLGGRGMKPVSIYDPVSNWWKVGATAPIELHHFQPVVYEDEIYIIGAMTGGYPGETPVEEIYVYSPATNTWRVDGKIPANRARGGAGVVVDDDMLYIVCGIKDGHRGDHKNWLDSYNLNTKEWKQLTDAPTARDHFQAAVARGKIYSLAGRTTISADNPFKHTIGTIDVYDIEEQTWTTLESELPTWRAGNAVLVEEDEILVIGGESFTQEPAHSEVEAFNFITKKWRSLPNIPVGRHGTGLVNSKGILYIASGSGNRGGGPELTDIWKFEY